MKRNFLRRNSVSLLEGISRQSLRIGPYILQGQIGHGCFSEVRLALLADWDAPGEPPAFACKIVPRSRLVIQNLEARFENEIRIVQQLKHPKVVQLVDLFKDELNYYIIMEYCGGGELCQFIIHQGRLSEPQARMFTKQILEALEYVHSFGICHRDLKPENILLDVYGQIKISDFGFSRFVGQNGLVETPCGSPCYASPECISGKAYDGRKSDIWSVGVLVYAMLTGQLPWTKRNQAQLFEQIRKGDYVVPPSLSENCRSFIRGLMTVNCDDRMSIGMALRHPWIARQPHLAYVPPNEPFHCPSMRTLDAFFDREVSLSSVSFEETEYEMITSLSSPDFQTDVDRMTHVIEDKEDSEVRPIRRIFRKRRGTMGM